jgi:hypothetical protein
MTRTWSADLNAEPSCLLSCFRPLVRVHSLFVPARAPVCEQNLCQPRTYPQFRDDGTEFASLGGSLSQTGQNELGMHSSRAFVILLRIT